MIEITLRREKDSAEIEWILKVDGTEVEWDGLPVVERTIIVGMVEDYTRFFKALNFTKEDE